MSPLKSPIFDSRSATDWKIILNINLMHQLKLKNWETIKEKKVEVMPKSVKLSQKL